MCFGEGVPASKGGIGGQKCANLTYLEAVLTGSNNTIDEVHPPTLQLLILCNQVTVHHYGLQGPARTPGGPTQCVLTDFLDPILWENTSGPILTNWQQLQHRVSPRSRIVLSETGTTGDGGCPGLSNTFAAGFFWIAQLGTVARAGYYKVFRQDLIGFSGINGTSSYALAGDPGWVGAPFDNNWANRTVPLRPNPDFFTTLLWQRLMGTRILDVKVQNLESRVRAYASCSRTGESGDVAIAFLNGGDSTVELELPVAVNSLEVFRLTSGDEQRLDSRQMRLNGKLLSDAADKLEGETVRHEHLHSIVVAGHSYGFAIVHGAAVGVCTDIG